jgi:hypothetical protein
LSFAGDYPDDSIPVVFESIVYNYIDEGLGIDSDILSRLVESPYKIANPEYFVMLFDLMVSMGYTIDLGKLGGSIISQFERLTSENSLWNSSDLIDYINVIIHYELIDFEELQYRRSYGSGPLINCVRLKLLNQIDYLLRKYYFNEDAAKSIRKGITMTELSNDFNGLVACVDLYNYLVEMGFTYYPDKGSGQYGIDNLAVINNFNLVEVTIDMLTDFDYKIESISNYFALLQQAGVAIRGF